ncbi:glycosyltransferase family 9 protein [Acidocella sp. KAb 2-4]|uniref:glycosyltransferase family 9 protein n=1 Tax=Acidocella sp. KAb 2-4 TaxID=2885158 RepID=UPI001D072C2F|nr:glycosyltransferase family 9 protein [Acidocella sp. KAb 2-4]MCB5943456.1 glycosyltransferase family 9 protein [Acidocella sp. KAb 2-4]
MKKILFITSSRIGDAVISCGILERLRLEHPEARFTIACGAVAEGVFARFPALERLIVFEKRRFSLHWLWLWRQVAGQIWDLVVDVRSSGISLFLAARRRVIIKGGRRPGRRYQQLGAALGYEPAPLPVTWTAPADDAKAAALLGDGPVIALAPTANWDGKIWPPERFVAVFEALAAALPGARAAIFGGPGADEARRAAPVLAAIPGAVDLVGKLSLPEAAACLRRSAIFIGNDSGLMHLAAAAGTPTLGLFGRSKASEYAPAGPRTAIAVAPGPEGEAPMTGLQVTDVLKAARTLLCA